MGNMLLLLATSHGCVIECHKKVKEALHSGTLPTDFKAAMRRVFHPLQSCGGSNWSTMDMPFDRAEKKQKKEEMGEDDMERTGRKLMTSSMGFISLSPNALPLFLEKIFTPKIGLGSPAINNRVLHYNRIWQSRAVEVGEEEGMIGTLLGIGDQVQNHDASFANLEYHLFLYKVREKEKENRDESTEDDLVMSEFVFAEEKEQETTHVVNHVSIDDLKSLQKLIKQVRKFMHCIENAKH